MVPVNATKANKGMITCRPRSLYSREKRNCVRCELQTEFLEAGTIQISGFMKVIRHSTSAGLTCNLSKLQLRASNNKGHTNKLNAFVNSGNRNTNF